MSALDVLRAVVGLAIVAFGPGLAWTYVAFRRLDWIARAATALVLSVSLLSLAGFAWSLAGLPFHFWGSTGLVAVVTAPAGLVLIMRKLRPVRFQEVP